MKISVEQMQKIKVAPNSPWCIIAPYFLFHSNKLEGSTFSEDEIANLIERKSVSGEHSIDDVLETRNSIEVLNHVVDTLNCEITHDFLIKMNACLFKGTSTEEMGFTGHYKQLANMIRGSRVQLALPSEVKDAMSNLLDWWYSSTKTLEDICHFHVRFEHIHPFQDGNGRVGRFLMLKQCIENGIDIFVIEESNSKPYKSWLEIAQTEGQQNFLVDIFKQAQLDFENKMHSSGVMDISAFV